MNSKPQNHCFEFLRRFLPVLFFAAFIVAPLRADDAMLQPAQTVEQTKFHYLEEGKPDATNLLAPPPLPDSAEQTADLVEVRAVSRSAPANDIAAALEENKGVSLSYFTPIVGDISKLPETEKFLRHVQSDAGSVVDSAKDFWKRPRPFVVDPTLALKGNLQKSFSYPSGHSTESMAVALVLADLFPDKREALLARAREIGWHRVEIARHYSTDIYAGRVLAQAIVKQMKKDGKFEKDFEKVKAEIAKGKIAVNN
ncbi:MAG TPA: phosphatase PAP2 family protein [Candidatus Baltobacteraceae bacterium]|nr:phosphatase PAP2 family protein [Candidatus Baltobacteraceae bacterium]